MTRIGKQIYSRILFGIAALLFILAISLQLKGSLNPPPSEPLPNLATLLPEKLTGWEVSDLPLADSPEQAKFAEELLSYDVMAFRQYRRGNSALQVFVTMWAPSKLSALKAGIHNPDKCWPQVGLTRIDSAARTIDALGDVTFIPGAYREYLASERHIYVAFWLTSGRGHLGNVDDSSFFGGLADRVRLMLNSLRPALLHSTVQKNLCYIRLSSTTNLNEFFKNDDMAPLQDALQSLGIIDRSQPRNL